MNLAYAGSQESVYKSVSEPFRRSRKSCVLSSLPKAQGTMLVCCLPERHHRYPNAAVLLLSLLFWNKFPDRYSQKTATLHEGSRIFFGFVFVFFFFCLSSNPANTSHWLTSHFPSCYLASTISSWNSPVQMDQYHSFVHTLKITRWITVVNRWLSHLDTPI